MEPPTIKINRYLIIGVIAAAVVFVGIFGTERKKKPLKTHTPEYRQSLELEIREANLKIDSLGIVIMRRDLREYAFTDTINKIRTAYQILEDERIKIPAAVDRIPDSELQGYFTRRYPNK